MPCMTACFAFSPGAFPTFIYSCYMVAVPSENGKGLALSKCLQRLIVLEVTVGNLNKNETRLSQADLWYFDVHTSLPRRRSTGACPSHNGGFSQKRPNSSVFLWRFLAGTMEATSRITIEDCSDSNDLPRKGSFMTGHRSFPNETPAPCV